MALDDPKTTAPTPVIAWLEDTASILRGIQLRERAAMTAESMAALGTVILSLSIQAQGLRDAERMFGDVMGSA